MKFFVKWHIVNARLPPTAKEGALVRRDTLTALDDAQKKGTLPMTDWGCFGNGQDGYLILDVPNEQSVLASLLQFMPDAEFEEFAVLSISDVLGAINIAFPGL